MCHTCDIFCRRGVKGNHSDRFNGPRYTERHERHDHGIGRSELDVDLLWNCACVEFVCVLSSEANARREQYVLIFVTLDSHGVIVAPSHMQNADSAPQP